MCVFREVNGGVTAAQGFLASGVNCGIKKPCKKDLALIVSASPARAAGTYTQNRVKAAPVLVTMENLKSGTARAIVCNSGIANACTGDQGMMDAMEMAAKTAEMLNIASSEVVVASTGVIGVTLPMDNIGPGITEAAASLSRDGGCLAAEAIMTTDTKPKEYAVSLDLGGKNVVIGGICKGSGMISPNMATMLCFITTDAAISANALRSSTKMAVDESFNMITVDGDMSTNDMVVVLANGLAGNQLIEQHTHEYDIFFKALSTVMKELAKSIARDGEGATKFIEILVKGAMSPDDAKKAALSIVNSNLVKTAVFGENPNWGRILAAVGYSGARIDPNKIDLAINGTNLAHGGCAAEYDDDLAEEALKKKDIFIVVDLGLGNAEATAWTCDFSYDYVKINAGYRT